MIFARVLRALILAAAMSFVASIGPQSASSVVPRCLGHSATIVAVEDTLTVGTPGPDVIVGSRGNDVIAAKGGNDIICGRGGSDEIYGRLGNDTLVGGPSNDFLSDGPGNDVVRGNRGGDFASMGTGDDVVNLGQDRDWLSFEHWHRSITVDLNRETAVGVGSDIVRNAENVFGSKFAPNMLFGSGARNDLTGGSDVDLLRGRGGPDFLGCGRFCTGGDTVFGMAGDDVIWGGSDGDALHGGIGADRILGFSGDDTIVGDRGHDIADGRLGTDTCSAEVERHCEL